MRARARRNDALNTGSWNEVLHPFILLMRFLMRFVEISCNTVGWDERT